MGLLLHPAFQTTRLRIMIELNDFGYKLGPQHKAGLIPDAEVYPDKNLTLGNIFAELDKYFC